MFGMEHYTTAARGGQDDRYGVDKSHPAADEYMEVDVMSSNRVGMLVVVSVVALLLVGCGGGPRVTVSDARLELAGDRTLVHLSVSVPDLGEDAWMMQPTFEATLRDNLGNEYKAIGGSESLNTTIRSGILYKHDASGTIVFPAINPNVDVVRLTIPLHQYRSEIVDALTLGFSGPRRTIYVGAVWTAGSTGFTLGSSYISDEDGSVLAAGTH